MRTTLELPDDLFREVKSQAALEGVSLKELLARYIQNGLTQPAPPIGKRTDRSRLPVIKRRGKGVSPNLTSESRREWEEVEDVEKIRRSSGR
jgi:hypothetical protein